MSKLRIVTKGTPYETEVFDENGNAIEGVTQVTVVIDAKSKESRVHITLWGAECDVEGELGDVVREKLAAEEKKLRPLTDKSQIGDIVDMGGQEWEVTKTEWLPDGRGPAFAIELYRPSVGKGGGG